MEEEAAYGFIVSVDVQGSGLLSDTEKLDMRRELYGVTTAAFEDADIRGSRLHQEDRGDGFLGVIASDVPPRRVVGEWLEYLYQNLQEVNRRRVQPLRLRAGLHIGPVTIDAHGRSGRAVDLACRLCDCDKGKAILLAAHPAPLVVIASDRLYEEVILSRGRWVDPDRYRRHNVELKEGSKVAWFMVPGLPEPPEPARLAGQGAPTPPPSPPPTASGVVMHNNHHGSGQFNAFGHVDNINNYGGQR